MSPIKSILRKACYLSDSSNDSFYNEKWTYSKFNVLKDSKLRVYKKANLIKIWTGYGIFWGDWKDYFFPILL
jgi:hypothetical protein